jgi:hypothetical protein
MSAYTYAEATERSAVDGGDDSAQDFPLAAYHYIVFISCLSSVIHYNVPVTSESYHLVITSNILIKKMARQLKWDVGQRGALELEGDVDRSEGLVSVRQ